MRIIKLFDEVAIMKELQHYTIDLIHATDTIEAIKKLIFAHDIINLNLKIEEKYKYYNKHPPWDIASLSDLDQTRRELLIYHKIDFHPISLFNKYNNKILVLFNNIKLRLNI